MMVKMGLNLTVYVHYNSSLYDLCSQYYFRLQGPFKSFSKHLQICLNRGVSQVIFFICMLGGLDLTL